jgi:hypothetical protein
VIPISDSEVAQLDFGPPAVNCAPEQEMSTVGRLTFSAELCLRGLSAIRPEHTGQLGFSTPLPIATIYKHCRIQSST